MASLSLIEKHLKSKGIPYKVVDLGGEVFTVEGVKKTGIDREEIVKTLVVRTNDGFAALAVRGKDRVDFKKVRELFGNRSELAKPEEVQRIVGVPVGAVCPILLKIPLYFDKRVMRLRHINMGSGDLTKGLEMDFGDLLLAVGRHEIADLTNNP